MKRIAAWAAAVLALLALLGRFRRGPSKQEKQTIQAAGKMAERMTRAETKAKEAIADAELAEKRTLPADERLAGALSRARARRIAAAVRRKGGIPPG